MQIKKIDSLSSAGQPSDTLASELPYPFRRGETFGGAVSDSRQSLLWDLRSLEEGRFTIPDTLQTPLLKCVQKYLQCALDLIPQVESRKDELLHPGESTGQEAIRLCVLSRALDDAQRGELTETQRQALDDYLPRDPAYSGHPSWSEERYLLEALNEQMKMKNGVDTVEAYPLFPRVNALEQSLEESECSLGFNLAKLEAGSTAVPNELKAPLLRLMTCHYVSVLKVGKKETEAKRSAELLRSWDLNDGLHQDIARFCALSRALDLALEGDLTEIQSQALDDFFPRVKNNLDYPECVGFSEERHLLEALNGYIQGRRLIDTYKEAMERMLASSIHVV